MGQFGPCWHFGKYGLFCPDCSVGRYGLILYGLFPSPSLRWEYTVWPYFRTQKVALNTQWEYYNSAKDPLSKSFDNDGQLRFFFETARFELMELGWTRHTFFLRKMEKTWHTCGPAIKASSLRSSYIVCQTHLVSFLRLCCKAFCFHMCACACGGKHHHVRLSSRNDASTRTEKLDRGSRHSVCIKVGCLVSLMEWMMKMIC
jgi:hypothetical protein